MRYEKAIASCAVGVCR